MARWHSTEYYCWPKSGPLANRRLEFDVSAIYKTFTSLEYKLSAAVAWQELGLQFCGAVASAKTFEF